MKININTESELDKLTYNFSRKLIKYTKNNHIKIFLNGNLGAGKSTFFRYFLRNLGYQGNIPSPTYSIIESYHISDVNIHHLDLYRISNYEDLFFIGWDDLQNKHNLLFIEWPETCGLEERDIDINISINEDGHTRLMDITVYNINMIDLFN